MSIPVRDAPSHYRDLLAEVYLWMVGDFANALAGGRRDLAEWGIDAPRGRVLDLGAGVGVHAIPLAEQGWEVVAVDASEPLLAQLRAREPRVHTVHADLVDASDSVEGSFDLILCVGDTLTHLDSEARVERALNGAARRLAPGGSMVVRFRDYLSAPRSGAERFILVRADERRIMTCCLDHEGARVLVTDLLHERSDSGWSLRASSYRKLCLSQRQVAASLRLSGLQVEEPSANPAWIDVIATKL